MEGAGKQQDAFGSLRVVRAYLLCLLCWSEKRLPNMIEINLLRGPDEGIGSIVFVCIKILEMACSNGTTALFYTYSRVSNIVKSGRQMRSCLRKLKEVKKL